MEMNKNQEDKLIGSLTHIKEKESSYNNKCEHKIKKVHEESSTYHPDSQSQIGGGVQILMFIEFFHKNLLSTKASHSCHSFKRGIYVANHWTTGCEQITILTFILTFLDTICFYLFQQII